MATHSSILAWRIPWTEEPVGLHSIGLQRVRHIPLGKSFPDNQSMMISPRGSEQSKTEGLGVGEASGRKAEEGREERREGAETGRLAVPAAALVFTFCHSLEHRASLKEFPRRSKFEEIKV